MENKMSLVLMAVLLVVCSANAQTTYNVTNPGMFIGTGFKVLNLAQTPDRIYPGDEVQLKFDLEDDKEGGSNAVQLNLLIPFLSGKQAYFLGQIAQGASKPVSATFSVPNNAKPGNYDIFVYVVDELGAQAQVGDIPLTINEQVINNVLVAKISQIGDTYAGDTKEVALGIENIGNLDATNVLAQIQYASTNMLIPIGTDRISIPLIKAHETQELKFNLGIAAGATPGYFTIPVIVNYQIDKVQQTPITQNIGFKVLSKTNLLITSEAGVSASGSTGGFGGGNSLIITIANVGDTPVRGVYAVASSNDYAISGSDKFIGTLNLDDSSTMSVTLIPRRTGADRTGNGASATASAQPQFNNNGKIQLKVTYKDALNIEHTQTQEITPSQSVSFGTSGSSANQRFGRNANQLTIFGYDPVMVGGGVILLVLIYFGYKWVRRKK